jgi:mannose-6-phosphate isomerase-like protein (cupin superfamily)
VHNKGKYKVGKVLDYTKSKGWFFGHFTDEALLKSDLVEVAWQNISNKDASAEDKHLHKSSVEINIILSGEVKVTINQEKLTLHAGEFYIIWPETIVESVEASDNTQLIVVRAPSIVDKVKLS